MSGLCPGNCNQVHTAVIFPEKRRYYSKPRNFCSRVGAVSLHLGVLTMKSAPAWQDSTNGSISRTSLPQATRVKCACLVFEL